MKTDLTIFKDKDLFDYFKAVSNRTYVEPLQKLELKKYDAKNVAKIKEFRDNVAEYVRCIQVLRSRGYTLYEILELIK
jgi:hypothetical protein